MIMGRVIRILWIALGIMLLQSSVLSSAYAVDTVAIRAGEHPTFGRLVMDWGRTEKFRAEIKDAHLVIHFDAPFEAKLQTASRILDTYVGKGSFIEDNKGVIFPLKGNFTLKTARYGTAIAFDLIKSGGSSGETQPSIKVRRGDHADFSRLVFDWPEKTNYILTENENSITLDFDKSGDISLGKIQRDPPKFVKSIKATNNNGKTSVTIETDDAVSGKVFRSGNSIALDLKQSADKPKETAVVKAQPVKKVEKKKTPVVKVTPKPASSTVAEKVEETTVPPAAPPAVAEVTQPKPRSLIPAGSVATKTVATKDIKPPTETLVVETGNLKDGFRLIFPWKSSTGMAFFERSGTSWLVFDKRIKLDFRNISGPFKFLVVKKKQMPHETATVARLSVREGYAPSAMRVGDMWQIDFRLGEAPVIENTVDIQPQPASSEGARVFIPAVNNGNKVSFIDPQAGDELIAIPLYSPSWGIGVQRTYAQFTILPSVQGIAMTLKEETVQVAVERNGISITAEGGLQLSRTISKEDLFAGGDQTDRFNRKKDRAQIVKIDEWAQVSAKEFLKKKQLLQRKVARAPKAGRNATRMELAKFFVAHKYYADAIGVLERIRIDDPRADEDAIYRLLRGLSHLEMNHIEDAEQDLFHPSFASEAEIAPWRAKLAAAKKDWKTASREIEIGKDAFGVYGPEFQNEFKLLQAEIALEDYDVELAIKALEGIKTSVENGQDPAVAAEREYLEGIAALRSGDVDHAISKFDQAMALDHRPVSARARYEKINAELAQKFISTDEAIEEFKRMEFAWRGDDLELTILKRIGDLYIATGKMREGLSAFRNIITTFPKTPLARDIAREMNDIFNQLFLEGEAEKLPPVKALALYYEYRELTPLGKDGDRMIRQLADRLIKVDLLDQAAQLLDHQVNFRLKGEIKSYTGTKLAVVHLWNGKPQDSLNTLRKTRWRALPDNVKQERLHIEARAYSDLGDFEEALGILEEDKSEKGDLLRADIYWKAKQWSKVATVLKGLLTTSGAAKAKELTPFDRQRLMQLSVALSLSNDQAGIAAIRKTYRKKLVNTPDLDAFDLITDATDGSETEFRKRSTAIAKISKLESFMAGYREQLKNGEFWATN